MKTFVLKKIKKFILSIFSLLFFVFSAFGVVSANNNDENDVDVVIIKQIKHENLNDKLKDAKLKKEQINDKTENTNTLSAVYYFEAVKHKKEQSDTAKTFFEAIASSSIGLAVRSVFTRLCGLFTHESKSDNNTMELELEKISKN